MAKILIVTGFSGAGKSTSMKALEDFGYETIDNLPLNYLNLIIEDREQNAKPLAIHIDTRTRLFSPQKLVLAIEELREKFDDKIQCLFLRCNRDVIARRYTETRHTHPMALGRPIIDGIDEDLNKLKTLIDCADLVVDTTDMTVHDLKRTLKHYYLPPHDKGVFINIISFSYKKGIPRTADLVFDMRFLKNPHYDEELRPLTGKNAAIQDYIRSDEGFQEFEKSLKSLLAFLLPRYEQEGKSYLTIAIGCSGGKHRSVFLAELIYHWLKDQSFNSGIQHREIGDL